MSKAATKTWSALLVRQAALEDASLSGGAAQFYVNLEKAIKSGRASAATTGIKRLLREGLPAMVAQLSYVVSPTDKRAARHTAVKWIQRLGCDVTAFITLRVTLDQMHRTPSVSHLANQISLQLLDELRYRRMRTLAPALYRYKLEAFRTNHYGHRQKSMNAAIHQRQIDVSDLQMGLRERVLVGCKLLEVLVEATGVVELVQHEKRSARGKRTTPVTVEMAPETREWLETHHKTLAAHLPLVVPMLVPPLPWSPTERGGYRFGLRGNYPLVRRPGELAMGRAVVKDPVAGHDVVYDAVNALQATAWKINGPVFEVMEKLVAHGGEIAGLPTMSDEPMPARPHDMDTNPVARKAWRQQAHQVQERMHEERQRRKSTLMILAAAQQFVKEAAIYFPHSVDFRGRVYPLAMHLTPQGSDISRGLLTFAQGKPMTTGASARWLALHGASKLGVLPESGRKVSMMTFDERLAWVTENSKPICDAADFPLEETWWAEAEHPFQFLAFCMEWRNLLRAHERGETYTCALPCAMDGTCNGLQHFSALLQDAGGGQATNLVPNGEPQDVYSVVAKVVLDLTERAAATREGREARFWLQHHLRCGLIDRKFVKRQTMTVVYGASKFGFREQLAAYLKERDDYLLMQGSAPDVLTFFKDVNAMADRIWDALTVTAVKAFEGMEWMQAVAKGIVQSKRSVRWTVPGTGFVVEQVYHLQRRERIRTTLAGKTMWPSLYLPRRELDERKAANAVAPNLIHSLDAAALMLTVAEATAQGVDSFAMVHDSYGTVPTDCQILAQACRTAFVNLYTQTDVLHQLYRMLSTQWNDPKACPLPPEKGLLDVTQVLHSLYFFA